MIIEYKARDTNKYKECSEKTIIEQKNTLFKIGNKTKNFSNLNKGIKFKIDKRRKKVLNEKEYNMINNRKIFKNILIFINFIIINLIQILSSNTWCSIIFQFSTISLKIKGNGTKNIFGYENSKNMINRFEIQYFPNEIYINGIKQNIVNYSYYFNQTDNLVELKWNNTIDNCSLMFYKCWDINELDLSNFDSTEVSNMKYMFTYCSSLTSLNLSNFNTEKVNDMEAIFYNCSSLTSLNLYTFNTSEVINMWSMFSLCSSLKSLDLSNFNTKKVQNRQAMFFKYSSLTSLQLSSFDTSEVITMWSMFYNCHSLISLNLSNFNPLAMPEIKTLRICYMLIYNGSLQPQAKPVG